MSEPPAPETNSFRKQLEELWSGRDEHLDSVLRGHLLIEQMLEAMLLPWFPQPEYLHEARLGFHQKLNLAHALNVRHRHEPIWRALGALNALRNDFAHRLTSAQREQKIRTFIDLTRSDFPEHGYALDDGMFSLLERFHISLGYLVGSLEQMAREYDMRARIGDLAARAMLSEQYGWTDSSPQSP
jgi:hypothetical protein